MIAILRLWRLFTFFFILDMIIIVRLLFHKNNSNDSETVFCTEDLPYDVILLPCVFS